MGSFTQVEQDDFKSAVEQFAERMEMVQKDIDVAVKDKRAYAAEMFEAAKLQSDMVFGSDDEPIPGLEAIPNPAAPSIALNTREKKKDDSTTPSNDTAILAETFERSTACISSRSRATNINCSNPSNSYTN